ncbi:MAG: Flp family type IVb pilin [Pirellulaceae bacterium]
MQNILAKVQRFLQSEDGPTAVEYAVMLALIIAVCFVAIQSVGTEVSSMYDDIAVDVNAATQKGGF